VLSRRRGRRTATLAAVLCAALTTGCSGPGNPLEVGVVEFGTDVLFGAEAAIAVPPISPGGMPVAPPRISAPLLTGPPPEEVPVLSAAPVVSCPSADPFAVARDAPTPTLEKPPRPATYAYRNEGTYDSAGATPVHLAYPTVSTRTVQAVAPADNGGFTFEVVNRLGGIVAVTGYQYVPPADALISGSTPTSGLYITRMKQTNGKDVVSDFTATGRGLLMLQVPVVPGTAWTSTATDAATGASVRAAVTVGKTMTVNACGNVIQAPTVHMDGTVRLSQNVLGNDVDVAQPVATPSGGTRSDPVNGTETTFVADYAIATQYGGISVQDTVQESGTQGGVGVVSRNTSIISVVPAAP
jgi:hypothetical protein